MGREDGSMREGVGRGGSEGGSGYISIATHQVQKHPTKYSISKMYCPCKPLLHYTEPVESVAWLRADEGGDDIAGVMRGGA